MSVGSNSPKRRALTYYTVDIYIEMEFGRLTVALGILVILVFT